MSMWHAMQNDRSRISLSLSQRAICIVALTFLVSCATRLDQAPVVDRSAAQPPAGPPPPGYYRVKPGDTLYRIALEKGQNYREIATWNNLTDPNQITTDQLLRVVPPGAVPNTGAEGVVTTTPMGGEVVASVPLGQDGSATTVVPAKSAAPSAKMFAWPVAAGTVSERGHGPIAFSVANKGINISGYPGQPVLAASDGRVVYAGNGLRGYGYLVIIKHDATYLTAYAHNRTLMVKEGDAVTKGQKIAEMGDSDADRVMLHFEVRRQGKPVDPLQYLPPQ